MASTSIKLRCELREDAEATPMANLWACPIGTLGRAEDPSGPLLGHLMLRVYQGIVSLTDPGCTSMLKHRTEEQPTSPSPFLVRLLRPNESVILTNYEGE